MRHSNLQISKFDETNPFLEPERVTLATRQTPETRLNPEGSEQPEEAEKKPATVLETEPNGFFTSFFSQALGLGQKQEQLSLHDLIEPKDARNKPRALPMRPSMLTCTKQAMTADIDVSEPKLETQSLRTGSAQCGFNTAREVEGISQAR